MKILFKKLCYPALHAVTLILTLTLALTLQSDDELEHAYHVIDMDGDGRITLREFASYTRGASVSTSARGKAEATKKKKKKKKKEPNYMSDTHHK